MTIGVNRQMDDDFALVKRIIKWAVASVVLICIGLLGGCGSWYTIDQGERGVLLTNGAVSSISGPGLHFKIPWFQSVAYIEIRQQVLSWNGEGAMQAYSRDQQAAALTVTVNYHIPESEVANVYSTYGSVEALAQRVIGRKAPQEIKVVFGQFDAVSVIQNRAKFNADAAAALQKSADGPVIVDSVQIENIDFSDAYEQAVEARMTAQVEVQKQEQQLAQEKIKADVALAQAQGRANSVKAEAEAAAYSTKQAADANAYKTSKEADANAYRAKIEGEATADAIKARAAALANNPLLVELTKAERWNGALPTSMIPGNSVPFVNVQ